VWTADSRRTVQAFLPTAGNEINITVLFLFAGGREERVASELAAVARLRRANTLLEQKSLRDTAQL
jgi:hypothetical protein